LAFLLGALSLTGIPPLSGFWAKFGVLGAALRADSPVVFTVALLVSVGTLMSMLKLGAGVFWGEAPPPGSQPIPAAGRAGEAAAVHGPTATHGRAAVATLTPASDAGRWPAGLVLPGLLLALLSLAVGLFPEPLLTLAEQAGATLDDPSGYVQAVLGP
jgi:multicomponent Na+:H+ antiporter subunit D